MTESVVLTVEEIAPYLQQIISAQHVGLLLMGAMLVYTVFFGRR